MRSTSLVSRLSTNDYSYLFTIFPWYVQARFNFVQGHRIIMEHGQLCLPLASLFDLITRRLILDMFDEVVVFNIINNSCAIFIY